MLIQYQLLRLTAHIERSVALLAQSDALMTMTQRLMHEITLQRGEASWPRENWRQPPRQQQRTRPGAEA
ncbi:MAG: hypothetical protein ACJ789_19800 [Thermomicrobiales bacterium]